MAKSDYIYIFEDSRLLNNPYEAKLPKIYESRADIILEFLSFYSIWISPIVVRGPYEESGFKEIYEFIKPSVLWCHSSYRFFLLDREMIFNYFIPGWALEDKEINKGIGTRYDKLHELAIIEKNENIIKEII